MKKNALSLLQESSTLKVDGLVKELATRAILAVLLLMILFAAAGLVVDWDV